MAGAVGPESTTESGEPRGTVAGVVIAGGDNAGAAVPHFQRGGDKRVLKWRGIKSDLEAKLSHLTRWWG